MGSARIYEPWNDRVAIDLTRPLGGSNPGARPTTMQEESLG